MEQNLISHYSSVRNYRPKGLDKERILQAVLLVAICVWFLYLINNSHHKQGDDEENISILNLTTTLGRKGLAEYTTGAKAETHGKNALGKLESGETAEGYENDVNIDEDTDQTASKLEEEEETRVLNVKHEAIEAEFLLKQVYNISVVNIANQYSEMEIVDDNGGDVLRVEAFLDENGIPPDAEETTELKNLEASINESSNLSTSQAGRQLINYLMNHRSLAI